jgi:hypothetical protein
MTREHFNYSYDGYNAAREYLEESEQAHLIGREQSTDGWTVIRLANDLKAKEVNNA